MMLVNHRPLTQTTRILGIDPGYDRLGWAVGEVTPTNLSVIKYGCIQTDRKQNIIDRYRQFSTELATLLQELQPDEAALENIYFARNTKTALRVSEARGVIIHTCLLAGLEIYEYDPVSIKLAVAGNGQADKTAVTKMVQLQLKLTPDKLLDDTLDALATLMTHAFRRQSGIL
jgi:crossover junction endodeoxyribonuclease RuvC